MNPYPPLKALVAFDATMRTGSFSLAAAELFVTPGAVGQQIQKLEEWLGVALFVRQVRQVQPTEDALGYWKRIQPALAQIADASHRLRERRNSAVVLSMPPGFATKWFASRMAGLGRVVFASRDEWAGAAVMAERIPYLKEMGPSVEGPIADLELPHKTWLLAAHGNQQVRSGSFIDRWRERHPLAAEVGSRLNTSQALRDVAADGVEAVWSVLAAELGSTD